MTPSAEIHVRYVTWGEYGDGVYESQVIGLVELIAEHVDASLLALVRRGLIPSLQPPPRGRLLAGPATSRWPWRLYGLRSSRLRHELEGGGGILHCRGPLAALAAIHSRPSSWKVIHDFRDLDSAQVEEERGTSRGTRRLARLEAEACRRADLVSCVSEPLRRIVVDEYGVSPARVVVNPTGVETSTFEWSADARAAARDELGIRQGPVLVYVGSAARWQLPDVCVRVAALLPDVTLLALSQDADVFRALADKAGLPSARFVVRKASRADVGRLVCAGDVALLPRMPGRMSEVMAPVKYAEYLAAGVPVVSVAGAGSFSEQIEREGLGAVAALPEPGAIAAAVEGLLGSGNDLRSRCRDTAVRDYDLGRIAISYVDAYRALAA